MSEDPVAGSSGVQPTRIGPYRVLDQLGSGGMGAVYLGEQSEPVYRLAAVKVVKRGMDSEEVVLRFNAERQALALMRHPCIASVYDAGTTAEGQPYFAMEFVEGAPLTTYCDDESLSIRKRLTLFLEVCGAVQHAHQKGVLHRDLKPSNILVTKRDGRPVPKVIDFGIAKATGARLTADAPATLPGQIIGTPEYMSPEQAGSGGHDVDTRTDIYSLGVLLYELLCGALPFGEELRAGGVVQMIQVLQESVPPAPSTRVHTAAAGRRQSNRARLVRKLRGDLDWIALRALEKNRNRRYASPSALAEDVQRHLDHIPVLAGPPTRRYRLARFMRRHRLGLTGAAAILIAVIAGTILSVHFGTQADRKTEEFDQLSAVFQLRTMQEAEKRFHPPRPDKIPAMLAWLADAERLIATRPIWQESIEVLDARASREAPRGDREEADLAEDSQRFLASTLGEVLLGVEELAAQTRPRVERLLRWSRGIDAWTRAHPGAGHTWQEARDAISKADDVVASRRYATQRIELEPELGLVPIGMNPVTKLWEFYHLRSAWSPSSGIDPGTLPIPRHRPDGSIPVSDGMGIVFILLPGDEFLMGAQGNDEGAPNFDRYADRFDKPPHRETVEPYFIAKHEMTQGQWIRLTGHNPSRTAAGSKLPDRNTTVQWTHPVESVSWRVCRDQLVRHGLALPTETQWEYACRGSSPWPWSSGRSVDSLEKVANVIDQSAVAARKHYRIFEAPESWTDGHALHAPVGEFEPNSFGLFDVHGNVWEWCADLYPHPVVDAYGLGIRTRALRGGSYAYSGRDARVIKRRRKDSDYTSHDCGCRAARALTPRQ